MDASHQPISFMCMSHQCRAPRGLPVCSRSSLRRWWVCWLRGWSSPRRCDSLWGAVADPRSVGSPSRPHWSPAAAPDSTGRSDTWRGESAERAAPSYTACFRRFHPNHWNTADVGQVPEVWLRFPTWGCCSWGLHCHWPVLQTGNRNCRSVRSCVRGGGRGAGRSLETWPSDVSTPNDSPAGVNNQLTWSSEMDLRLFRTITECCNDEEDGKQREQGNSMKREAKTVVFYSRITQILIQTQVSVSEIEY